MIHQLPDLPYNYSDLEPVIDSKTMEIHHSKHHQAYIDNLNNAIKGTPYEVQSLEELFAATGNLPVAIRNNAGGHYNHSLFWSILTKPNQDAAEQAPTGALALAITESFGSLDAFKTQFAQAAATRFGSGWAWLCWSEAARKLVITSTPNQDNPLMAVPEIEKATPIIGLDVWEHAYYLKYQNKRPDYVASFWKVLNWEAANTRYLAVRTDI